jgi:hypothetical protein
VPPVTLLLASWFFLITWRNERQSGRLSRESLVLGLILVFSCQAFIMSFPRTDETHIQFNGTALFILMAFVLHRLYIEWAAPGSRWEKAYGTVLAVVCVAALCIPYLWSMKIFRVVTPGIPETYREQHPANTLVSGIESGLIHAYPEAVFDFPRSIGLSIPIWHTPPVHPIVMKNLPDVIHYIRDNSESAERIFVMSELQVIYFLAERESILQKENYFSFLAAVNLIDQTDTVRLTDEQVLGHLTEARPRFIIQENTGGHTENMIAMWPKAAAFVAQHYGVARIFGSYIILEPRLPSAVESHLPQ